MNVRGYEEVFECPYNKAHQILKHRFQTHLIKCRKGYPNVHKVQCPFNVVHMVNEPELSFHVTECPDRASFDRYKYNVQTGIVKTEEKPKVDFSQLDGEENWDDLDVPTYDPQKYVENADVLRTLNVAPPAERNAFRESEMRRLNELKYKKEERD